MVPFSFSNAAFHSKAVQSRRVVPLLHVSAYHLSILVREKIKLTKLGTVTSCSRALCASATVSNASFASYLRSQAVPPLWLPRSSAMFSVTAGEDPSGGSGK